MLKTSSIGLLTGSLILLNLLVPLADAKAADAAAGQELESLVVRAGGKVVEGPEGVVSIDLCWTFRRTRPAFSRRPKSKPCGGWI
jgi:hypothetical protein